MTIICSDEARNGKTLFARLLCDQLSLSGDLSFRAFDTDFPRGDLAGYFPESSQIIDFDKTGGKVSLFDTIINEPDYDYLIDLDARFFNSFFKLYQDISFEEGLAEAQFSIQVYFVIDRTIASLEAAKRISQICTIAHFIPVRNEAMGNVLVLPQAAKIYKEINKAQEVILPRLSIDALNYIDGPQFSYADFLARNGGDVPLELRIEIWSFLEAVYNQREAQN